MNRKAILALAALVACSGCASGKIRKSQDTINQAATSRSFEEYKSREEETGVYPAGIQARDNKIIIKSRGKSFLSVLDEVARIKRFNYTLLTDISKFYVDYYDFENTEKTIASKTYPDGQTEALWNSYVPQQFASVDDFVAQSIILIKKSFEQTEDKSLRESANNLAYRWTGDGFEFYNKQVEGTQADANFSPFKKIFLYNLTEKEVAFYISRLMDIPYAPYSPNKPINLPHKKSISLSDGQPGGDISVVEEKLPTKDEWRLQQQQQVEPSQQTPEINNEVWKSQSSKRKVRWITIPQQNAIIIKAEPDILREISQLLYAIDSEYKQIIIEARVFEYDAITAQKIGMALENVGGGVNIKQPVGAGVDSNITITQTFGPAVANALPLTFSQLGRAEKRITLLSAISAYGQDGIVRISSEPRLILKPGQISTVDITTTKIVQPTITQQIVGTTTIVPVNVEVGVFFTVKPTLLSDNKVQLDMYLKQSEFVPTKEQNVLLSTTQNQMTTSVVTNDGEWISLGGMISNKHSLVNTGIPMMKDIPGAGLLFGNDNEAGSTVIVEFMVRPIIKNLDEESRVPIHRVNFLEDRLKRFKESTR